MFTTGFKFYFGLALGIAAAAVIYGYTTGGGGAGPAVWGWKGGIGDHLGYVVLMGAGVAAAAAAIVLVYFRDGDAEAQAEYLGVADVAPDAPASHSIWPVVGAFGAAAAMFGLVIHPAIFVTGLAICAATLVEWMMVAWADRATADPEANKALRNRIMAPLEIPVAGAALVGLVVLAASRILLNASRNGAVLWAGVIAVVILGIGTLYAVRPRLNPNVVAALVLAAGTAVLAGGIVAAVDGEREFHPHVVHDHAEDHADDDHAVDPEDDHADTEDSHSE